MQAHLSEEQIFEALLAGDAAAANQHLAGCSACAAELDRLRRATAALRHSARTQAERSESFWSRQRRSAASRISRPAVRPLTWVAAIAAAILAAMLLPEPRPVAPAQPATDPDQALLVSVERAVNRQVPQALAPATLLTQEMSRNLKPTVPHRHPKGEPQ